MTRRTVVAVVVLLLSYAAPSNASTIDLLGATVSADYHWPTLGTVLFPSGTDIVDGTVEFDNIGGFGVGISPAVDFSATNIRVSYPAGYQLAGTGTFDGWVFSVFGGTAPAISGVSLAGTNIAGFTASRLSFNASQVFADQLGLGSWGPGSFISIDVQFVPEPATLLMLGTGLMAAAMRKRLAKRS